MAKKKYDEGLVDRLQNEITTLRQSIDQLYALNELARQIGSAENLDKANQRLVRQVLKMINAEQGVVTLIDSEDRNEMATLFRTHLVQEDESIYRPDPILVGWMAINRKSLRFKAKDALVQQLRIKLHPNIRSFLCAPLLVKNELIGLLSLFNKKGAEEFSADDEKLLYIIAMQSAQILDNQRLVEERNRVKLIFGQHVSPAMVDEILSAGTDVVNRRLPMCVMFMDIRGFSTLAEKLSPEDVMGYLNSLFDFMIECVIEHKGIIHRLLGDSFVALFGAPISHGNDRQNAVDAGAAMLNRLEKKCLAGEIMQTRIGIGIHYGEVVVGTVGSTNRKEYQINGDVVNLAARIEQLNKQFDSQMLISETVYKAIDRNRHSAESLGQVNVKGREESVHIYKLV